MNSSVNRRDFTLFHPDCRFTDDSVCTLAVTEALLIEQDFAATLRAFVRRHPRRGYGGMFLKWALTDDAPAYGSWGNGAPMRVAAVGWLAPNEAEAMDLAATQAAVCHNHPAAVSAAQAVALAIFLLRRGASRATLRLRLVRESGYSLEPASALAGGGFDVSAAGAVPHDLAAALTASDWEGAVCKAVCLDGDTDTLARIAGAVAKAAYGLPEDAAAKARSYLTEDLISILDRFDNRVTADREG